MGGGLEEDLRGMKFPRYFWLVCGEEILWTVSYQFGLQCGSNNNINFFFLVFFLIYYSII